MKPVAEKISRRPHCLINLLVALGLGQEEPAGLTADRFNWPIAEGLMRWGFPPCRQVGAQWIHHSAA